MLYHEKSGNHATASIVDAMTVALTAGASISSGNQREVKSLFKLG
jgi:hypothetical protein